ncbi:MAG TPA: hypothetical protein VKA15_09750, partial [Isosphaeraceae bacterium]|nr:hypothetical protein [Isosphaeraceae bacterium]
RQTLPTANQAAKTQEPQAPKKNRELGRKQARRNPHDPTRLSQINPDSSRVERARMLLVYRDEPSFFQPRQILSSDRHLNRSPPRRHDLRTPLRESKITLQATTDQMNPSQTISFMESMN